MVNLNVCGIIAEFDPFHLGHQHLLREAKRLTGCDYTVCVISTAFLQRGTPGLFSTRDRARMALEAGADAVFALPVSFSCAAADRFALGGVRLLNATGVVTIQAFGCENADDLPLLMRAAACLNEEPSAFKDALRVRLQAGLPYPKAQAEALAESCGIPADLLSAPNNILAVAYLRQLELSGSHIRPVAIQRRGSRNEPASTGFLPSSALRARALQDGPAAVKGAVPPSTDRIVEECFESGRICRPEALTQALFYRLYTGSPEQWAGHLSHQEGLEGRLQKALDQHPATREELLALVKTKRYTHAFLQRWLSRILLDLPPERPDDSPRALRLLGFRASARPLISAISDRASLPLITKPARGKEYLEEDARAELVWSLGTGQHASLYEQSPVILPDDHEE